MSTPAVQPSPATSPAPVAPPDLPADNSPLNRRTLRVLAQGQFGRYAVGETVSMTGTWMQGMAQSWVMTGLTRSAFELSWVQAAASVPMLALTMYGGTVADRFDKRRIIIITQVVQIVLAVAVGWLVMTGRIQIWHILTAAVLLGISASFEMPSSSALVPELVEREHIAAAIAIDRSIFHGTRLIGPALAGWLIGYWGTASAFYANAASFVALIAAILLTRPRPLGTAEEEQQRTSGMKAGIDYVRQDRPTLAMLALMGANSLWIFPYMAVMMPLYARDVIGLDSKYTGFLMAVSGIGSLVASVGLLSVPRSQRLGWMIVGTVDIALSLTGLGFARTFGQAACALATLAVGTSFNFGLANTTVQERAPNPLRGRVSALAMMSFVGVMPFAALALSKMADLIGMRTGMFISAGGYALCALVIFAGPARRMSMLPAARPVEQPLEA